MPALLLSSLLVVAAVVAVMGPPRAALVVLATTWLLVPGRALLPGITAGHLLLHRLLVLAVLLGVVRGVIAGRIDRDVFAIRGVHAAFTGYLVVALATGVVLAGPDVPAMVNTNIYLGLVDQGVFFVTALAVFRAVGAGRSALTITAVAAVTATIGISEAMFSWSYAQWFSRDLSDPGGVLSLDLTTRGPHERIRVAATFALEYGWVAAMLLPLTVAVAVVARRHARIAWAAPALLMASMILTWSRSAYAGLAVGMLVLSLGIVLDRPHRALPLGAIGLGLSAVLLQGPLREALDLGATREPQDVRFERLPEILGLVADRPITGLGLGGLLERRVSVVDISWVNTYATIGVIGVVALSALFLSACHAASRFILSAPSPTRVVAAGAAGAVVAAPLGFASYDLGTLRMSTETLWGMVALAVVANERLGVLTLPPVRRGYVVPTPAVVLGVLGLVGGLGLGLIVPERSTIDATYSVANPRVAANAPSEQKYTIKVLSQTACLVAEPVDGGADVQCQDLDQVAGGVGTLRIEAATTDEVEQAYADVAGRLLEVFPRGTVEVAARGRGRPSWATTAPLWLPAAGFALGATAPDRTRRPTPRPSGPPGPTPLPGPAPIRAGPGGRRAPASSDREPSR